MTDRSGQRTACRAAGRRVGPARLASWAMGAAVLAACCGVVSPAVADDAASRPLSFRRVFVPENRFDDWPRRPNVQYVPVPPREFERLLSTIKQAEGLPNAPQAPRLVESHYEARLTGSGVLQGSMRLEIEHSGSRPALVPLSPCGVALAEPRWEGSPSRPANVGVGPGGELWALAEQSGTLHCDWSLRGERRVEGGWEFALALPRCPRRTMDLELPAAMAPRLEGGSVAAVRASEATRVWQLHLGSASQLRLTAAQPSDADAMVPPVLRQATTYVLSPRGIDVTALLTLDVTTPLERLLLDVSPELRVVSAYQGESPIALRREPSPEGTQQVALELPAAVLGTGRAIRVNAVSVASWETARSQRLPFIRPQGVFWQQATATIRATRPLALDGLTALGGRQSSPLLDHAVQVQLFAPDAEIDVVVAERGRPPELESGLALQWSGSEITGQLRARFAPQEGRRFALSALVGDRWTIDRVESLPPGQLAGWHVDIRDPGRHLLEVRLHDSLSPGRDLVLAIDGRRLDAPQERVHDLGDLRMLRFRDVRATRELLSLSTSDGYALRARSLRGVRRLDPATLSREEAELFAERPSPWLYRCAQADASLSVLREPEVVTYKANVHVDALVTAGPLWESYSIRCVPAAPVSRLYVQFSEPRPAPLRWSLGGEAGEEVRAVRLSGQALGERELPPDAEVWEVNLARPRSAPFEVRAVRATETGGATPLCLASLPEAGQQEGSLQVRAAAEVPLRLENRALQPVMPDAAPEHRGDQRAAFRFDPGRDADAGAAPIVVRYDQPPRPPGDGLVWLARLESSYTIAGAGQHRAVYFVENRGGTLIMLRAADGGGVLRSAQVDGKETAWNSDDGRYEVPLPPGRRFVVVTLDLYSQQPPLGVQSAVRPPWPQPEWNVIHRRWHLRLPPGFAPAGGAAWQPVERRRFTWAARLLGPLLRPAAAPRFDPLSAAGWSQLIPAGRVAPPALDQGGPGPPWNAAAGRNFSRAPAAGTNFAIVGPADAPAAIDVIDTTALAAWGYCAALVIALAVGWLSRRRRDAAVAITIALVLAAALLVPEAYVPFTCRAALGVLLGLAAALFTPRRAPADPGAMTSLARPAAAAVVVLGLLTWCCIAGADEAGATSPVYRVLIPVDPDGDASQAPFFYVPEPLYRDLRRRAAEVVREPRAWLLERARYRATLAPGSVSLDAAYELRVFGRGRRVALDLGDGDPFPVAAVLDGQALDVAWDEQGRLGFDVAEPGAHQLELRFARPVETSAGRHLLDFGVPAVPRATLELSAADGARIEVPTCRGTLASQTRGVKAALGPAQRLTVQWRDLPTAEASALDVKELLWLQIKPGSVVLHGRFRFQVATGSVAALQLEADPRLQLREITNPEVIEVRDAPREPGSPGPVRMTLELDRPLAGALTVDAKFLLTDASGIGNLRLPRLSAVGARMSSRQLAVSVAPSLIYEVTGPPGMDAPPAAVPAAAFLADWGSTPEIPAVVYQLPQTDGGGWTLTSRPREAQVTVRPSLDVSIGAAQALLLYDARLTVEGGLRFGHHLRLPEGLTVEEVSVKETTATEAVQPRLARWAQHGRELTLFLSQAAGATQRLQIRGRLPVPASGRWPLPSLEFQGGEMLEGPTHIWRQPDVIVTPEEPATLDVATDGAASAPLPGQLLGQWPGGEEPLVLHVAPNPSRFRAVQIIALEPESDAWRLTVDCQLRVLEGAVDELSFEVPAALAELLEATPPAQLIRASIPGQQPQRIVVTLPSAGGPNQRVVLTARIPYAAGQPVVVPNVRLLNAPRTHRYVLLPQQRAGEPIEWVRPDLDPAPLPELDFPTVIDAAMTSYAAGEDFHAALQTADAGAPRVNLADVRLHCQSGRTCRGVASFDLNPAGLAECVLRLPEGCHCEEVTVAGLPVSTSADELGIRFPLASDRLLQRIEVVFTADVVTGADRARHVHAPRLAGIPAETTLWTVYSPAGERTQLRGSDSRNGALEQQRARLRSVSDALAQARLPDSADELQRWYLPWARRLAVELAALRQRAAEADQPRQAAAEARIEARSIQEEQLALAATFSADDVVRRYVDQPPVEQGLVAQWQEALPGDLPALHQVIEGTSTAVVLRPGPRAADALAPRLLAALAALALCGAALLIVRRWSWELPRRWPGWLLVVAGLAWWLWLAPSALGWALIALGLAAALYRTWPPVRDAEATVTHVEVRVRQA